MLLETTTALDAIKFKTNLEKALTTKAPQYAKLIYIQALKFGVYNKACSEYIQDWFYYSISDTIKTYCNTLPFSIDILVASLGKSTYASVSPNDKIMYISKELIDSLVKNTIEDLKTFVYAPSDKNYDSYTFTIDNIADGIMDGYLYGLSMHDRNEFIATVLHEISHLQQMQNNKASGYMTKSVANNKAIVDDKEKYEDYKNQPHEIDAWANDQVAKYILDNPEYTLSDIKTQTVYLTKKYSQFGDITLSNETKKKFAAKVFKLLYQNYHQK